MATTKFFLAACLVAMLSRALSAPTGPLQADVIGLRNFTDEMGVDWVGATWAEGDVTVSKITFPPCFVRVPALTIGSSLAIRTLGVHWMLRVITRPHSAYRWYYHRQRCQRQRHNAQRNPVGNDVAAGYLTQEHCPCHRRMTAGTDSLLVRPEGVLSALSNEECIPATLVVFYTSAHYSILSVPSALPRLGDFALNATFTDMPELVPGLTGSFTVNRECAKRCGVPLPAKLQAAG